MTDFSDDFLTDEEPLNENEFTIYKDPSTDKTMVKFHNGKLTEFSEMPDWWRKSITKTIGIQAKDPTD